MESQNTDGLKEALKQLIAKEKPGQVIQLLLEITQELGENNLRREVLLHAGSYRGNIANSRQGILTRDVHEANLQKIKLALLGIIEELPDRAEAESVLSMLKAIEHLPNDEDEVKVSNPEAMDKQHPSPNKKWRGMITGLGVISILVGIVGFTRYTFKDFFAPSSPGLDDIALDLIMWSSDGTGDHINDLKGKATVTLDFGGYALYRGLAANDGKVYFEGIPKRLKSSSFKIRLGGVDEYLLAHPDSLYVLNNNFVYVEVHKTKKAKKSNGNNKKSEEKPPLPNTLSRETKNYKFFHSPMKNPIIVLKAEYTVFNKAGGGNEFTIISLPVEVKYIDSLKFVKGDDTCVFQGALYDTIYSYSTICK
ncbi:MAG: hypothetical protein J5I98_32910 [Phaeodactylibacter sp.]|nr:hypothetical protein [Phaeodactylibacter sp.]